MVSCALPATAAPINRLYVFGDSYSDFGAGYVDCDGPTAVAYLAWNLGLEFTHARAPKAGEKSIDFAVSGAQTGEGEGRGDHPKHRRGPARERHEPLGVGEEGGRRDHPGRIDPGGACGKPTRRKGRGAVRRGGR